MFLSDKKVMVYMDMARAVSQLSKDEQTKVGAVLISSTGRQIASGYNGFLRGAIDEDLPKTRPEKYVFTQHAERNLLYNCLDEGIRPKNSVLICTLSCCADCLRAIYQSGIRYVIYDKLYQQSTDFYKQLRDMYVNVEVNSSTGFTHLYLHQVRFGLKTDPQWRQWYDDAKS